MDLGSQFDWAANDKTLFLHRVTTFDSLWLILTILDFLLSFLKRFDSLLLLLTSFDSAWIPLICSYLLWRYLNFGWTRLFWPIMIFTNFYSLWLTRCFDDGGDVYEHGHFVVAIEALHCCHCCCSWHKPWIWAANLIEQQMVRLW